MSPISHSSLEGCIGASISGISGRFWGRVIAEDRRNWHLQNGRTARKAMEGKTWRWVDALNGLDPEISPSNRASLASSEDPLCLLPEPSLILQESENDEDDANDEEDSQQLPVTNWRGVGSEIVDINGHSWGCVVAEDKHCWRLEDGRIAKKLTEGKKWRWAASLQTSPSLSSQAQPRQSVTSSNASGEDYIIGVCSWLSLKYALRASMTCRAWAGTVNGQFPILLPPPQMDLLLQFCLLEVLMNFDDSRLPLPLSAVYSDMLSAGRRLVADDRGRERLAAFVCREAGPACKSQQERFLKNLLPHHVAWLPDVKSSGFKSVERFGKHFSNDKLVEVILQTWRKRIHHSPNTRTCKEWLLTRVNRQHKFLCDHHESSLMIAS